MVARKIHPSFRLTVNGTDVTPQVKGAGLWSITLTDREGSESDELSIRIPGEFSRPAYQDKVKVWLGYESESLFYAGLFLVSTTSRDRMSGVLTINATSADFTAELKTRRNLAYEKTTVKEICAMIAARNGLGVKCDVEAPVEHRAQTNESDHAFLLRMAKDHNAVFEIKNGNVLLLERDEQGQAKEDRSVVTVSQAECGRLEIEHAAKTAYGSCRASWHDTATNKVKTITHSTGEGPVHEFRRQCVSESDALNRAKSALASMNKGLRHGSLTTTGRQAFAGTRLELTDAGDDSGMYSISTATHTLSESGYSLGLEFE